MKLWQGRFSKEADKRLDDFNSSIHFDKRMYEEDIKGSLAHVSMLSHCKIIEESESLIIKEALLGILDDINSGSLEIGNNFEDIHMFVETILTERIGDTGKRLHTARSRNDQVALDIRMHLLKEVDEISSLLKSLINVLCKNSKEHLKTIMPGYTHLQRAQPITFAHHLMAYSEMFLRDLDRLSDAKKRLDVMPLGSGALAGTTYPLDREMVATSLGFSKISQNSLDAVSDRDFIIEIISCISTAMMHLSRLSEEIILWCSWEFKFIDLDDAFSTGSSIMPQKKNPDIPELVRGKTGRVYGDLMAILTVMKGLPLAYNKDTQEDKEAIFDAIDTIKMCLDTFIPMLETIKVHKDNMRKAAGLGFINATDCADFLVKKGMPFREAYKITGTIVGQCIDKKVSLEELSLDDYKIHSNLFDDGIFKAINMEECAFKREVIGGPAPKTVEKHIEYVLDLIK